MSEGAEQDRSELPSQFKLEKARREGSVARGMDLGFLSLMIGLTGFAWFAGRAVVDALAQATALGLSAVDAGVAGPKGFMALVGRLGAPMAAALLPMLGCVFAIILIIEFVQTGPVFSMHALRLDFGRLDPGKGLKRVFNVRILIETAKGVIKLTLYTVVAGIVVMEAVKGAAGLTDVGRVAATMGILTLKLLASGLAVAAIIAILDQLISRQDFTKRMRMSRREVKREHRDREGDARLKQRRKELHGQFAQTSQSLRGVRQADLIVVNPVHFAVAMRYRPDLADAPIVVSRGTHAVALRLKRLAFSYGVPVVVDPGLAQRLYRQSMLGSPLPEALFQPVAAIYLNLRRQSRDESLSDA